MTDVLINVKRSIPVDIVGVFCKFLPFANLCNTRRVNSEWKSAIETSLESVSFDEVIYKPLLGDGPSLIHLFKDFPNIDTVNLPRVNNLTINEVQNVIVAMEGKRIKHLRLHTHMKLDSFIDRILFTELEVFQSQDFSTASIGRLCERNPKLKTLACLDIPEGCLAHTPHLSALELTEATDAGILGNVGYMSNITKLSLRHSPGLTLMAFERLRELKNLIHLEVVNQHIDVLSLCGLANPGLKELHIGGCPLLIKDFNRNNPNNAGELPKGHVHNLLLSELASLRSKKVAAERVIGLEEFFMDNVFNFTELSLDSLNLVDTDCELIEKHCQRLKLLRLTKNRLITDRGLSCLVKFGNLQDLRLSSCSCLTDESLKYISANLSSLHSIYISYLPNVTSTGMLALATSCKKLHTVCAQVNDPSQQLFPSKVLSALFQCPIRVLCTNDQFFSEFDFKDVPSSVLRLELSDCALYDSNIEDIVENCGFLESLVVRGVELSESSIQKFSRLRYVKTLDFSYFAHFYPYVREILHNCRRLALLSIGFQSTMSFGEWKESMKINPYVNIVPNPVELLNNPEFLVQNPQFFGRESRSLAFKHWGMEESTL